MKVDVLRRRFLQLLGASSAALATPFEALAQVASGSPTKPPLPFEHVVVLMLENRSFDNMLGNLYGLGEKPNFQGVAGRNLSNPIPSYARDADRKVVPVGTGTVMDAPNPDPGENYPHVNTQLFGTVVPATNRDPAKVQAPYNLPPTPPAQPPMDGFVVDYVNNFVAETGREPGYDDYKAIMQCFGPTAVPVISTLAKSFAVCDHWFCDVPSSTWTNRSFFNAASSGGLVTNSPMSAWLDTARETIFNRMSQHGISWNVYYDTIDPFPLTGLIHFKELKDTLDQRFQSMERFYQAVDDGTLPQYSFVEPRFFVDHNDQHPPITPASAINGGPSSVLAGELLIHQIYDAIRRSSSPNGSNFQNTLLVITYDEHGGCYDHVPPPASAPPDLSHATGQMGFAFDRLGLRVPTVLISAHIEPGTIVSDRLQHTSMIKTMSEKWNLGHLTQRDREAPDISPAFNRSEPRSRDTWPVTSPRPVTPSTSETTNLHGLMNELQSVIMRNVSDLENRAARRLKDIATMTVYQALVEMNRIKRDLGLLK